jgi:hypothetical protein
MPGFTLRPSHSPQPEEGTWTPYGPEPTEAERARGLVQECYKIRLLTPKKMTHWRTVAVEKKWENNQLVEKQNDARYTELMYDELIEDWQGVYLDEEKTQPAPCTLEYKVALMTDSLDRQNFIILQGSLYANNDDARRDAQRANFRPAHPVESGLPRADL